MLLTHLARVAVAGITMLVSTDTIVDQTIPVHVGDRLEMKLATGGTIHVTAWNEPSVSINAALRDNSCPDGKLAVTNDKGAVVITSTLAKGLSRACAVPDVIEIKVPEHFDISIESNGGGVTITGVTGRIEGRTSGGDVKLSHVDGRVKLATEGGDVDVQDSHLAGSLRTASGRVTFVGVSGGVRGVSDSEGTDIIGAA
jgi:hypothetical protein